MKRISYLEFFSCLYKRNFIFFCLFFVQGCGNTEPVILKRGGVAQDTPSSSPSAIQKRVVVHSLKFPGDIGDPVTEPLPSGFPTKLSQTGIFGQLSTLTPNPGILEYRVQMPLWSDGTSKKRFLALPGTSQITFSEKDSWTFPVGTVLIKHFEMPTSGTVMKRLETRVFIRFRSRWAGFTYKWNGTDSDADLLTVGVTEPILIYEQGMTRTVNYYYPSQANCLTCHNSSSGFALGVHTRQMNRDGQLNFFNSLELFDKKILDQSQYAEMKDPDLKEKGKRKSPKYGYAAARTDM